MTMTDLQVTPRSRGRSLLFAALATTLGTVLGIGLVEIGLRLTRESDRFYPYHPNSVGVSYPSEEITPGISGPSYFTVNSCGARGPELAKQPLRILTVGGSTTACTALDDDESWPALLMQNLNEHASEDIFWVTNSGKDGENSHHHLMHVKYFLPQLPDIDYVIVYAGLNDVVMWLYVSDWDPCYLDDADNWASRVGEAFRLSDYTPADAPWYKRLEIWKRASTIRAAVRTSLVKREREQGRIVQDAEFEWMQEEQNRRQAADKKFVPRAKMESLPAALDSYARNLEQIIELVRKAGAAPILMAQATDHLVLTEDELRHRWMGAMDGGRTYVREEQMRELIEAHNARMKQVAEKQGALYIDLPSLLEDRHGLYYDGYHFNEHGSRVAARRITSHLWNSVLEDAAARAR